MKKIAAACLFLALVAARPVEAASFNISSLDVDLRTTDPGLVLWHSGLLESAFELNTVGTSTTIDLFKIGTKETALNIDDLIPYAISAALTFSSPSAFVGEIDGITGAGWFFQSFGYVVWDNPVTIGNGLLEMTLSHAAFGLPGEATVEATFTLLKDLPRSEHSTPEPGTLALLGVGAAAAAWRHRRRQAQ